MEEQHINKKQKIVEVSLDIKMSTDDGCFLLCDQEKHKLVDFSNQCCLKGLQCIPDKSIDMILVDPPYEVTTRNEWDIKLNMEIIFKHIDRIVKDNAVVVMFSQGFFTAELMNAWKNNWRYNLIWKKNKPRGFLNSKKMPLRYHEDIVVFYKKLPVYNPQMIKSDKPIHGCTRKVTSINYGHGEGGANNRKGRTDRYPGSVLEFPVLNAEDKDRIHPTQKPVELCEFLIKSYTDPGSLVLDFCAGSATTCIAALRTERRFMGFEKNQEFYKAAVSRINREIK